MQLAAFVDGGRPFVSATYLLEGDGPLVFNVYDKLQEVVLATTDVRFPSVNAVEKKIAPDDPVRQGELISAAKDCIRPGLTYFRRRFSHQDGHLLYLTQVYRALRLGSPMFVRDTNPTMEAVEAMRRLPVLSSDTIIESLKDELPVYKAACADLPGDTDIVGWWQRQNHLPNWKAAVLKMLHITPSSAAVERVFSLLNSMTSRQQDSLL